MLFWRHSACILLIWLQVVKKCLDLGAQKALYIAADMAVMADADRVVAFAEEQLEGLDYIVLNHIGPSPYGMWDGDVDHVQWLMQVRRQIWAAAQQGHVHITWVLKCLTVSHYTTWSTCGFMDVGVCRLHDHMRIRTFTNSLNFWHRRSKTLLDMQLF